MEKGEKNNKIRIETLGDKKKTRHNSQQQQRTVGKPRKHSKARDMRLRSTAAVRVRQTSNDFFSAVRVFRR